MGNQLFDCACGFAKASVAPAIIAGMLLPTTTHAQLAGSIERDEEVLAADLLENISLCEQAVENQTIEPLNGLTQIYREVNFAEAEMYTDRLQSASSNFVVQITHSKFPNGRDGRNIVFCLIKPWADFSDSDLGVLSQTFGTLLAGRLSSGVQTVTPFRRDTIGGYRCLDDGRALTTVMVVGRSPKLKFGVFQPVDPSENERTLCQNIPASERGN